MSELDERVNLLEAGLSKCKGEVEYKLEEIAKDLDDGDARMTCIEKKIDELSASVNELKESLETLLEIFETSKRAFIALGWAGKGIRWIALTGGGVAVIWYFLKTGSWHK